MPWAFSVARFTLMAFKQKRARELKRVSYGADSLYEFLQDEKFDDKIKLKLKNLQVLTKSFDKLHFTLALNYGSRSEIVNAIKKISKNIEECYLC